MPKNAAKKRSDGDNDDDAAAALDGFDVNPDEEATDGTVDADPARLDGDVDDGRRADDDADEDNDGGDEDDEEREAAVVDRGVEAASNDAENSAGDARSGEGGAAREDAAGAEDDAVVASSTEDTAAANAEAGGSSSPPATDDDGGDVDNDDGDGRTTDDGEKEKEEGTEEVWDLKVVLPIDAILSAEHQCEGCDLVACCVYASNRAPDEPSYACLDCQLAWYEGWPPSASEIPLRALKDDHRKAMAERCSGIDDPAFPPHLVADGGNGTTRSAAAAASSPEEGGGATEEEEGAPVSSSDGDADGANAGGGGNDDDENEPSASSGDEEGDLWELKKILGAKELSRKKPTMCDHSKEGDCELAACSLWVCSGTGQKWYSCLDHQEADYGGWPESDELPVKFLAEDHSQLIAEKCSVQDNPRMPDVPAAMPLLSTAAASDDGNDDGNFSSNITPQPPGLSQAVADGQSNGVVVGMALSRKGGKKNKVGVTPSPHPAAGGAAKAAAKKPSAQQVQKTMAQHAKWQEAAEKLGGPDAKIIIKRPDAKKAIKEMLYDQMKPVNMNQAFQFLKGTIPPPILKTCLDDMVDKYSGNPFDDDSDDEDGKSSKKKASKATSSSDEYAGSVKLKEGKTTNATLYYLDHTKLANNGNGLLPELRNELLGNIQTANAECEQLSASLKNITSEATRLESEPKNEELAIEVATLEKDKEDMDDSLEAARVHAANAKRAEQVKKGIAIMGAIWRKRKRQCFEFISVMEECTDGTITLKKCLKGDGHIDIDSDEAAIEGAKAFASRKKARASLGGRGVLKKGGGAEEDGVRPDENFIGVTLNAQGVPERVFLTE